MLPESNNKIIQLPPTYKNSKEQNTLAPSSMRVSMRTAVWTVMCRQPAIRASFSGFVGPYFLRIAIKPGISFSAKMISLRPKSAKEMSATKTNTKLYKYCHLVYFQNPFHLPTLYAGLLMMRLFFGTRDWTYKYLHDGWELKETVNVAHSSLYKCKSAPRHLPTN